MNVKLIALDCDGTLLNSKKKISDVTKSAMAKAMAHGIKVMLASARPFLPSEAHPCNVGKRCP